MHASQRSYFDSIYYAVLISQLLIRRLRVVGRAFDNVYNVTSHVAVVKDTLQHTVRCLAVVLGNLHIPVTSYQQQQLINDAVNQNIWKFI